MVLHIPQLLIGGHLLPLLQVHLSHLLLLAAATSLHSGNPPPTPTPSYTTDRADGRWREHRLRADRRRRPGQVGQVEGDPFLVWQHKADELDGNGHFQEFDEEGEGKALPPARTTDSQDRDPPLGDGAGQFVQRVDQAEVVGVQIQGRASTGSGTHRARGAVADCAASNRVTGDSEAQDEEDSGRDLASPPFSTLPSPLSSSERRR